MKAITIKQPWAYLIASGVKDIENRTWKTHFRGRVYIHVSAKKANFWLTEQASIVHDELVKISLDDYKKTTGLFSAIIGEVDIVDCVINHPSIWAEKGFNYASYDGTQYKEVYNWVLANPILYEKPILNVKGKLSFWDFDPSILNNV
ncbi:ASCH domain-containing protein [Flavobacterium sp. CBA20B-1]|uniref:ASCH domain-containing protein n=1 Tax=unclassified Flavobacterium TaxID=196869 RepID=UPI002224C1A2|nr:MULTISPECIES: ASCH domain-containing protein [unclassified Flavobacterium]WCM42437.1 ASCH domain-containing protein [Flavobacterium sp. CBA20B-1]